MRSRLWSGLIARGHHDAWVAPACCLRRSHQPLQREISSGCRLAVLLMRVTPLFWSWRSDRRLGATGDATLRCPSTIKTRSRRWTMMAFASKPNKRPMFHFPPPSTSKPWRRAFVPRLVLDQNARQRNFRLQNPTSPAPLELCCFALPPLRLGNSNPEQACSFLAQDGEQSYNSVGGRCGGVARLDAFDQRSYPQRPWHDERYQ